jgi:hypothetical protein
MEDDIKIVLCTKMGMKMGGSGSTAVRARLQQRRHSLEINHITPTPYKLQRIKPTSKIPEMPPAAQGTDTHARPRVSTQTLRFE